MRSFYFLKTAHVLISATCFSTEDTETQFSVSNLETVERDAKLLLPLQKNLQALGGAAGLCSHQHPFFRFDLYFCWAVLLIPTNRPIAKHSKSQHPIFSFEFASPRPQGAEPLGSFPRLNPAQRELFDANDSIIGVPGN
jgi:hypothetical protein